MTDPKLGYKVLIMNKIAIFASGGGSNAREIIKFFRGAKDIEVALVACNKPGAGVLSVAEEADIPVMMIEREKFFNGDAYLAELKSAGIDFIVLAGFLWKIPVRLTEYFKGHIINIHPALLPKFGGKGMYGLHVHEAVISSGEKESGITIHLVDEQYDHGRTIFQAKVSVDPNDTPESLALKIHDLEHRHFPEVIEKFIKTSTQG